MDTCDQGPLYQNAHIIEVVCPFKTNDASNKSLFLSIKGDIRCLIFNFNFKELSIKLHLLYFYFFNWNFSLILRSTLLELYGYIKNILIEGTVSQNFDVGLSFYFRSKT